MLIRGRIEHGLDDIVVNPRLSQQDAAREREQFPIHNVLFRGAAAGIETGAVGALQRVAGVRHGVVEHTEAACEPRHQFDERQLGGHAHVQSATLALHSDSQQGARRGCQCWRWRGRRRLAHPVPPVLLSDPHRGDGAIDRISFASKCNPPRHPVGGLWLLWSGPFRAPFRVACFSAS
jgi:hypothetical protein